MTVEIRPLRAEDFADAGRIFFCAIHEGTRHVYTREQRRAWAGETIDLRGWEDRLSGLTGFIAEENGEPVGFMTIDRTGYVDLAFVLPSAAGKGTGSALLSAVEHWAAERAARRLTAAASLAARPFFEKHGWTVLHREEVERQGVSLPRYQMQKIVAPGDQHGIKAAI